MKIISLTALYLIGITLNLLAQEPLLKDPNVEKIASGFNFVEGPLWIENTGLVFSDIPENTVFLLNTDSVISEYIKPSSKSNGLAFDNNGNLILCQHFSRQVAKYENGGLITLASHYNDKRLNSPNDLCIKSNGSIFFTDPPFGLNDEGGISELGFAGIYSLTANGKVHLLDKTLDLPNGIAFSPDEKKLYVIDSQVADIYVWDVVDDSTLANKTLFYNMNTQWGDGMKTDANGFLYVSAANGITVFSAAGNLIENIYISSSNCSNCAWGSINGEPTMYVTSGNNIFRLKNKSTETGLFNIPESDKNKIHIYPNPSKGVVTFSLNQIANKVLAVEMYAANGQQIEGFSPKNIDGSSLFTFRNQNPGLFHLVVRTEKEIFSKKVMLLD